MPELVTNPYDEVSYPSRSFSQSHPNRLATMARLFGMTPATVTNCRVLELGCGDGGNLIPMAFGLPESSFVGIDLAARPIEKGRQMIEVLRLTNIELAQFDLMDVTPSFGEFDYIIAHGLYSWVPEAVRDRILSICETNLAPTGVAFISYNTMPGGHLRVMLREMMLFHIRDISDPKQRLEQGRALMQFLSDSQPEKTAYGAFLKRELELLLEKPDGVLYHDELTEFYTPVYFHEFTEHAARYSLKYVAEADFVEMQPGLFPHEVCELLKILARNSLIRKEQYLDFLKCRRFRQTLLCHREVALDRGLKPETIAQFYVGTHLAPVSTTPDLASNTEEEFRSPFGAAMSTDNPLVKAALLHLCEIWPRSIPFDELRHKVGSRVQLGSPGEDRLVLCEALLSAYAANMIELGTYMPHCVTEVSERPVASPVARLQIQNDNFISTLRHMRVQLEDPLARHLFLLLDGTRDRTALLEEISGLVKSGLFALGQDGEGQKTLEDLPDILEENLKRIASLALLVA